MTVNQISFDELFMEQENLYSEQSSTSPLHKDILKLLESNISSALEICEYLIESGKLSNERYSSEKPKAYPKICSMLDEMVQQGNVLFIEDKDKKDRIYQLKQC